MSMTLVSAIIAIASSSSSSAMTEIPNINATDLYDNGQMVLGNNVTGQFRNFAVGLGRLQSLYTQPSLRSILKTSILILITAESVYIITAETVDFIFYRYSILLSFSLSLFVGAFNVVAPESYRKLKLANRLKT